MEYSPAAGTRIRALVLCGTCAGLLPGCGGGKAPPQRPNVVLISVDTLRADHLPTYGYGSPTAPRMDEFARGAVVFDRCYAEASHTLLTHATLMTGVYPETHGVVSSSTALPDEIPTLAAVLEAHGYRTAAFLNCGFFHPEFGLDRGFQTYDYYYDQKRSADGDRVSFGRSAEQTNAEVFRWLDGVSSEPFLLFVHYYDVHSDWNELPYEAPPEHRERFETDRPHGFRTGNGEVSASRYLLEMNRRGASFDEAGRAYLRSLYDAGISYADSEIGALLDRLRERRLLDRSVVILLSDHGEEFQEHGKLLHTQVYEELVRVPLMVSFPADDRFVAARRVASIVQLSDVLPTLLELLDIDVPPGVQGRSFLPLLGRDEAPPRLAYVRNEDGSQYGVLDGRWKLVAHGAEGAELFDLNDDPGETVDLASSRPEPVRRLRTALENWRSRALAARPEVPEEADLDEQTREQLEALGYVGGPSR